MIDSETRPRKDSFDQPRTRLNSIENSNANVEPSLIVEDKSPNERYVRSDELIMESAGGILLSYKAFDTNNGVETAWHKINLSAFDPEEQDRLRFCICTIEDLNSDVLIRYQDTWYSDDNQIVNIITTNLESLKEFISKVKTLRWRIVKKWCKQFLVGLQLLHSHTPAIIHRHFNFSHIYIDGGMGTTAIGDLWLAAFLERDSNGELKQMGLSEHVAKLLTYMSPAYTAPESFEGNPLTTKVDIYCLGMCVLEMLASEEPYKECGGSVAKLRSKVLAGLPPQSLQRIQYHAAKDFITECLLPAAERPSAAELVKHEFLLPSPEDDDEIVIAPEKLSEYNSQRESASTFVDSAATGNALDKRISSRMTATAPIPAPANISRTHVVPLSSNSTEDARALHVEVAPVVAVPVTMQVPSPSPAPHLRSETASPAASTPPSPSKLQSADAAALKEDSKRGIDFTADGRKPSRSSIDLVSINRNGDVETPAQQAQFQLLISIPAELFRDGNVQDDKEVEFTFDCATDSYQVVSAEMVQELGLVMSVQALSMQISHMIEQNLTNNTVEKRQAQVVSAISLKATSHSPVSKQESLQSDQDKGNSTDDRKTSSLGRPTGVTVASPCAKVLFICCQADDTPSHQETYNSNCVDNHTGVTSPLHGSDIAFDDGQTSQNALKSLEIKSACLIMEGSQQTAQDVGTRNTSTVESASELVMAESGPVSTLTVSIPSTGPVAINRDDDAVPVEPPEIIPSSNTVGSAEGPIKVTSISGTVAIPSHLDEHAVIGGVELQQELEKIDQEERVARRAFENRIQKLITIQEKCEEDILKLDVVYAEKNAELQKKHDRVEQQRDADLACAEAEYSLKLQDLKQRLLRDRERDRERDRDAASYPQ